MDHRKNTSLAYDPDFLTTNFFEAKCQQSHKQRLKTMKPYIDSRTNKAMDMPHMKTRLKKKMNDRHKRDRIERENLMLLNRLSHVMRTKQVDDTHDKAFTSNVHRKTLAIKRQFKWNRIAAENERMGRRIQNAKSQYSRKKLKQLRKHTQSTPAANSRLVMPWTLGKTGRNNKRATWTQAQSRQRQESRQAERTGMRGDGTRMMPSITMGFQQSPASAQAPFMTMDRLNATAPPTRGEAEAAYNAILRSATMGRNEREEGKSGAMAAWEEIKSWSLWDMPIAPRRQPGDVDLRLTRSASADNTATGTGRLSPIRPDKSMSTADLAMRGLSSTLSPGARTMPASGGVAYTAHDGLKHSSRRVTKPLTGAGTRYIGGDVMLLRQSRNLNDGEKWALAAVEAGTATNLQDDAMAGFRIDAKQAGNGPSLSLALSVEHVLELAANWNDKIISSTLSRCKPLKNSQLYTRLTSLRVTDIGHQVTAAQWEEESNRARYLRRRFGKFLLDRVVVDLDADPLRLDMDWGVDEDDDDRVTWSAMEQQAINEQGSTGQADAAGTASIVNNSHAAVQQEAASTETPNGSSAGAGEADSFSVAVSLMGGLTGEPVSGATVSIETVDGQIKLGRGVSDSVGTCTIACSMVGWRDTSLQAVVVDGTDGVDASTGLLCVSGSNVVDATILVMPPADE